MNLDSGDAPLGALVPDRAALPHPVPHAALVRAGAGRGGAGQLRAVGAARPPGPVFAQIWHAAVVRAQAWVWWASGIVLGAVILTLFALFEKRRNDVLKMIDDLRRWR